MEKNTDIVTIEGSGRKANQRMKHFLVYQYLLKNTDENHPATGEQIAEDLKEMGIPAERRSIYKDIKELNIAFVMQEEECTFEEAESLLNDDPDLETIKYKHPHGFYAARRPVSLKNAALLVECVYNARFVPESRIDSLIGDICAFLSFDQQKKIKHDVFLVDRQRTNNKENISNIQKIDRAIKQKRKISFQYTQYKIGNKITMTERRKGLYYIVSPYKLIIHDGYYYLLGLDEDKSKILTYRLDRIKKLSIMEESREVSEEYHELMRDIKGYTQRVFSMYGGKRERVEIKFINPLLDTVIDRFGVTGGDTYYSKFDENHFKINATVEVSEQFFAWVSGFGKRAKILFPEKVVTQYKEFLKKISDLYE